MTALAYPGGELTLFAQARNWKRYLGRRLSPYLAGEVLEVGAGLGANTPWLCSPAARRWLCLEPDPDMAGRLDAAIAAGEMPGTCQARQGTIADLAEAERFDAILYVDVLEHIADDRGQLARAAAHLKDGGRIVVMSPAHPFLFSPFDRAIGHVRRYRRSDAKALTPAGLDLERASYLDSVGLAASLANKLLLRSAMPSLGQVMIWDRLMVPVSRWLDPALGFSLGKSVLFVWRKPQAAASSASK